MNKDQKQTVATSLLMAALMVQSASAGLIEDLTTWVWNYVVYANAVGGSFGCWYIGGIGLVFDDDNGAMMQTCMDIFGGASVTFPVEYTLNWADNLNA